MSGASTKADIAGVVLPPPLIYAIPLGIGLLLQGWRPLPFLPSALTLPLGVLLMALGFVTVPAVVRFVRAGTRPEPWKPTTALVTDGPYRFSRNPMYLGFTLGYLGLGCLANTAWPLIFLPVVIGVMHWGVIAREEAYLERLFGEEYRAYRARVRRWI